jgi:RHS repeat-associated protein
VGSVRLVVNADTGEVAQRIDYDEFGNVLRDTHPGFQPFGFQGGLYDRDTGLVRFGSRDYDPKIGRWLTKDPLGFEAGLNFYAFCGNDPVNKIDPMGLCEDGDQVLQNIRDYYDALEVVANNSWWVNDAFLEYLALFSLSGGPWGPLDFKYQGKGPFSVGDQTMPGDYFGNYVAGYQAGYGDAPGLLTGVFLGGEVWAAGPGDEPTGDANSVPAIAAGYAAGRDAKWNRNLGR